MNGQTFLVLYGISLPIFLLIDLLWLGVIAKSFYHDRLGALLEFSVIPAVIFYLLFLIGLTFFATYPAVSAGDWQQALIYGALFGFFTYATYDLTNLATLRDWPVSVAVVDILWGTALGGSVAVLTYHFYQLV